MKNEAPFLSSPIFWLTTERETHFDEWNEMMKKKHILDANLFHVLTKLQCWISFDNIEPLIINPRP